MKTGNTKQCRENWRYREETEALVTRVVDACFRVHSELGAGLLESAYSACLQEELRLRGMQFRTEQSVPLVYRERQIDVGFRVDLLIEDRVVIELKAVEKILPIHKAQLITYLKILGHPLGLLVNFNEVLIKDGIHRVFNPRLA